MKYPSATFTEFSSAEKIITKKHAIEIIIIIFFNNGTLDTYLKLKTL